MWLVFLMFGGWEFMQAHFADGTLTAIALAGFLLSAFVIGTSYHALAKRLPWLDKVMPKLAIVGILYVTAMTTASGRDNLLQVGALLFLASQCCTTLAGYGFGYWLSRGAGLDKNSARSIAFEVGLQNGGMASGLAERDGQARHGRAGGGDFHSVDEHQRLGAGELLAQAAGGRLHLETMNASDYRCPPAPKKKTDVSRQFYG